MWKRSIRKRFGGSLVGGGGFTLDGPGAGVSSDLFSTNFGGLDLSGLNSTGLTFSGLTLIGLNPPVFVCVDITFTGSTLRTLVLDQHRIYGEAWWEFGGRK